MVLLVYGIALIVLSCISSATGLLLLKSSAEREAELPVLQRYRWMAGFTGVAVVATLLNIGAYAILPMAVIAPFAGLTIVVTLLLASTGVLLDPETMSAREILAAVIILVGVGLSSVCGGASQHASADPDVDAMNAYLASRYRDPLVVLLLCAFIALPVVFFLACRGQRLDDAQPVDLFGIVHVDRALVSTALSAIAAASTGALSNTSLKITIMYVQLTQMGLMQSSLAVFACDEASWPVYLMAGAAVVFLIVINLLITVWVKHINCICGHMYARTHDTFMHSSGSSII